MEKTRIQINNLRDYAELAQASYFYFDFLKDSNNIPRKIYELDSKNDKIKDKSYPRGYKEIEITLEHIVNQKYYNHEVLVSLEKGNDIFTKMKNEAKDSFNLDKLNGEFSEIQAKNFAKRYKIYFHQANTLSGFSATLFYDIQEDRFVVGFRGTELNIKTPLETSKDLATDIGLTFGKGDFQVNALKQFLLDIAPILNNVVSDKIIFVGHSLGGYLAVIAMQFCDTIDRTLDTPFNQIKFTASQVYTFNSPAIDGIGNMTTRILADLQGDNILEQILNPQKVYCVYDNGGIKLIASAQYGASNRIPIYTGKDSHSIIPLTQTLYLYSYLLDSQSNYDKVKDKDINECIEYLNTFMQGVYKVFNPLSIVINNKNLTPYKTQEKRPDSTDFLPTFIEHILYVTSLEKERESIYIQLHTTKDNIIDKIIVLSAEEYYPKILDKQDIDKLDPKQCSIAEKRAIFKCQPFTIIDRDGNEVLGKNNIAKLFRYNSNSTKIALYSDESNTSYFDARISMMKSILYDDEMRVYYIREAN